MSNITIGDIVRVKNDDGKTFVGVVSGLSASSNGVYYRIKDKGLYPASRIKREVK